MVTVCVCVCLCVCVCVSVCVQSWLCVWMSECVTGTEYIGVKRWWVWNFSPMHWASQLTMQQCIVPSLEARFLDLNPVSTLYDLKQLLDLLLPEFPHL